MVSLVDRRRKPGGASVRWAMVCSARPGALCGIRARRARGTPAFVVLEMGGVVSVTGPGEFIMGGCLGGWEVGTGGCGVGVAGSGGLVESGGFG